MFHSAIRMLDFVFGPTVTRIHKSRDGLNRAYNYHPTDIEELSEKILAVAYAFKISVMYSSPFWLVFISQKGNYNLSWSFCLRFLTWSSCVVGGAYLLRGFGRSNNREYVVFWEILRRSAEDPENREKKKRLRRYDFDYEDWPIDYISEHLDGNRRNLSLLSFRRRPVFKTKYDLIVKGFLKDKAAFVLANTFGLWLMYPGSIGLLKCICAPSMRIHRSRLIEEHGGMRAKLCAEDGNMIDTMFIDRRTKQSVSNMHNSNARLVANKHGDTLVICCEGNAGFYECGCMSTPMQCGYSVLGWNHPGYMCSTGVPYPMSDVFALDVVVEYAIRSLQFPRENIILFAYALGSFSAISVAPLRPHIKGLILDSAFDNVEGIAKCLLPKCLESLVAFTVRKHLNVDNLVKLRNYVGPLSFICREKDEVLNLEGPEVLSSNVGNKLLEDFLQTRFPNLFDEDSDLSDVKRSPQKMLLQNWLGLSNQDARDALLTKWDAYSEECSDLLIREYDQNQREIFPMEIGVDLSSVQKSRLVLFLATKYMHHFSASHSVPLPPSLFIRPWSVELLKHPDPVLSDVESEFEVITPASAAIEPIQFTSIP